MFCFGYPKHSSRRRLLQSLELRPFTESTITDGARLEASKIFTKQILLKNKISSESLKQEIIRLNQTNLTDKWQPKLSNNLREVIEKAAGVAHRYQYWSERL